MLQRFFQSLPETARLLFALIPICIVRALPSLHQQLGTLGYDYGFYRYAALHASFVETPVFTGVHGGYAHVLLSLFHKIHIPPDMGLIASIYVATILLGIALFYFLRTYSQDAAIGSCFLLACSVIQSQAYTMFLWKTVIALPILVIALWALQSKRYMILAGTCAALLITHRTSLFLLLLTVAAWETFRMCKNRNWKLLGLFVISLSCIAGLYHSLLNYFWQTLFNPSNQSVAEGIFPIGNGAVIMLLAFALLGFFGCKILFKQNKLMTVVLFTGLCGIWAFLRLPFYHRVYVYFDLGLLMIGSVGLAAFWHSLRHIFLKGLVCVVGAILLFSNIYHATKHSPLIQNSEIQEITSFSSPEPAPFVLAVSANDAPWLLGYLRNARLAAPGLFEDVRTENDWRKFWLDEERRMFLSSYPKPLYIYDRSFKLSGPITQCLTKVSSNFSKYTCE